MGITIFQRSLIGRVCSYFIGNTQLTQHMPRWTRSNGPWQTLNFTWTKSRNKSHYPTPSPTTRASHHHPFWPPVHWSHPKSCYPSATLDPSTHIPKHHSVMCPTQLHSPILPTMGYPRQDSYSFLGSLKKRQKRRLRRWERMDAWQEWCWIWPCGRLLRGVTT